MTAELCHEVEAIDYCLFYLTGNKVNNIDVVYTPWSNLKKTASMDVGQVGFYNPKMVSYVVFDWLADIYIRIQGDLRTFVFIHNSGPNCKSGKTDQRHRK